MPYSKKLSSAKILLTINAVLIALLPWVMGIEPTLVGQDNWTAHGRFHYSWTAFQNLLALPVFLYLLWGKLHGTGRSIRIVAFLSLAYIGSFFVASAVAEGVGPSVYDNTHGTLLFGIDGYVVVLSVSFILTVSATLLSIKNRKN